MWLITAWSHWGRIKSWFNKSGIHKEEEKRNRPRNTQGENGHGKQKLEGRLCKPRIIKDHWETDWKERLFLTSQREYGPPTTLILDFNL